MCPLPAGHKVLIFNSAVQREKTKSSFNVRVAECRIGVALLRRRFGPASPHSAMLEPSALGLTLPQVLAAAR